MGDAAKVVDDVIDFLGSKPRRFRHAFGGILVLDHQRYRESYLEPRPADQHQKPVRRAQTRA